jgi:hypothetical protein
MKMMKLFTIAIFLVPALLLLNAGCSSRSEVPVALADSTITYPAKIADDISAKITLCRNISRKTGKQMGVGTLFTIRENESVRAIVDLKNIFKTSNRELMFHLDWINENGNSVFLKRIDLSPDDSSFTLISSLSISPEKRQPGEYNFRVYLFRELIAEKKFKLRPEYQYTSSDVDNILKKITLCRTIDKETGAPIGVDSVFITKENGKVRAIADLNNLEIFGDRELKFSFDWIDENGKSFFRKEVDLTPDDSSSTISSSIPISPNEKQPGKYILRLCFFDDLIAEKKFELRNEPILTVNKASGIKAKIELCKNIDKKTGERMGVGTVFTIAEKEKVRALIDIEKQSIYEDQTMSFRVDWIGPNGKSIYKKQIDLNPGDSSSTINSSISISPENRKPGKYIFRIYLFNDLIGEKKFELLPESNALPSKEE